MTTINLAEAKAHLGRYGDLVRQGEEIVLCARNVPVALIVPYSGDKAHGIQLGLAVGAIRMSDDFNAPLTELESDFYGIG